MAQYDKIAKNVSADFPDARDWIYTPPLIQLDDEIKRPVTNDILNQGREGACTGFALAAAINQLRALAKIDGNVSARMLYEMAKKHDEWTGDGYEGSSLRGAIHGWKNMGVCLEQDWGNGDTTDGLTVERAKLARHISLGSYYRIRPVISDYHAALKEVGVIICSARVHSGWNDIQGDEIQTGPATGGHAFAIVGYSQKRKGFWVQNSWGKNWGEDGYALWKYQDWIETVMDAWVFRLALDNSEIFSMQPKLSKLGATALAKGTKEVAPKRDEIAGHFVHIDNGLWSHRDRYWSDKTDIEQTVKAIAESDNNYEHIVIYAHGGLNTPEDSARRIAAMKPTFKSNGVYPFHIMYDTGLVKELRDIITGKGQESAQRTGGVSDFFDSVVEKIVRRPGTLFWEEMKRDAKAGFVKDGVGSETINIFYKKFTELAQKGRNVKFHFVGHSTGAVLFGYLLKGMSAKNITFETVSLLAPACSIDLFADAYVPVLNNKKKIRINNLRVYNLRDRLEQDDVVASSLVYRKSLLYLVSNSFEKLKGSTTVWAKEKPLLGMEKFEDEFIEKFADLEVVYSNGTTSRETKSLTHGGFDNDEQTMNDVLKRILKSRRIKEKFTKENLTY